MAAASVRTEMSNSVLGVEKYNELDIGKLLALRPIDAERKRCALAERIGEEVSPFTQLIGSLPSLPQALVPLSRSQNTIIISPP